MSHMTKMDTTVKLKNIQAVLDALTMLQGMYQGLTFSHNQEAGRIQIRYKPIEGYRDQNMSLQLEVDTYKIVGDPYKCRDTYMQIVNQIQICYQASLGKMYASRNKYTTQVKIAEIGRVKIRNQRY